MRLLVILLCLVGFCIAEQCEWKIGGKFVTDLIRIVQCGDLRVRLNPDHRIECFHVEHFFPRGEELTRLPTAITVRFDESTESELFYYAAYTVSGLQTTYCVNWDKQFYHEVCRLDDLNRIIATEDIRIDAGWLDTETHQLRRERCKPVK